MAGLENTDRRSGESAIERAIRIVAAYLAASIATGMALDLLALVVEGPVDPVVDRSFPAELLQQIGVVGIFAFFTAIFAAPVAAVAIIATELAGQRHPAVFALAGVAAAVPAMFRTGGTSLSDISVLVPVGSVAGLAFWFVRHRLGKNRGDRR